MLASIHRFRFLAGSALVVASLASGARANLLTTNANFDDNNYPSVAYDPTSANPGTPNVSAINGWTATFNSGYQGYSYYGVGYDDVGGTRPFSEGPQIAYLSNGALETAAGSRAAVTAGTTYDLTFVLRNGNSSSNPLQSGTATVSLVFYGSNASSTALGSTSVTFVIAPNGNGTTPQVLTPYAPGLVEGTAPIGATYAAARIVNLNGPSVSSDTYDLEVAVPEPASMVCGLAVMGLIARRRRTTR